MTVMDDAWWIGAEAETASLEEGGTPILKRRRRRQPRSIVKRFIRNCLDRLDDSCIKLCGSRTSVFHETIEYPVGTPRSYCRSAVGSPLSHLESFRVGVSQEDLQRFNTMGKVHDWTFTIDDDDEHKDYVFEDVSVNPCRFFPRTTPPRKLMSFTTHKAYKEQSCNRILFREQA